MAGYEELRQRHFNEMVQRLPAFIARATWAPEQLKGERERLLRDLIRMVKLKSPWHRQRLARVDPDWLREEDLADLPVMTKADLMANYDDILTDRRLSLDLIERHLDALTDDAYLLDQSVRRMSCSASMRPMPRVSVFPAGTSCRERMGNASCR